MAETGGATPAILGEKDDSVIHIQRRVLTGKDRYAVTALPFVTDTTNDLGRRYGTRKPHLEGVRGILGFLTLLAIFFRTFAPAIQTDTDLNGLFPADFVAVAPAWQNVVRRVLSPLLWDSTLLPHFFIILSGRVCLQTFLERRLALPMAAAAFHRPFRLLPSLVVCLAITTVLSATHSFDGAYRMATDLRSSLASPPLFWTSPIEFFNTIAALYFAEPAFTYEDRPFSFVQPVGILFVLPIIFQQTFTCITVAYILPYTKLKPKVVGYTAFVVLSYWVGSWAWYSLTGLAIAEFASVYSQITPRRFPLKLGRYLGTHMLPVWVPFALMLVAGLAQKWAWASFPERRSDEYMAHTDILTGGLVRSENIAVTPFPRIDDWMVATSILVLIEIFPAPRRILSSGILRHMGRLAFSIMLCSGFIFLSLGASLRNRLVDSGWSPGARLLAILFFSMVPLALAVAELIHWLIDMPSVLVARWLFVYARHEDLAVFPTDLSVESSAPSQDTEAVKKGGGATFNTKQ